MAVGYLHSYESFGAVDGPGIRFIAFFAGCPLRCVYCHNPDTWQRKGAIEVTADELICKVLTYKSFIRNGGVTLSGGEPLLQHEFCVEFLENCKAEGIHSAIDTSGAIDLEKSKAAIDISDLMLLDIKDIDSEDCKRLTGMGNENAMKTLEYCESIGKPVWIRHVLLPQYTLNEDKLKRLAAYIKGFSCVQKTELLPYHTMGKYKWDELGLKSEIENIEPPTADEVTWAKEFFE